jgi:hypothetical protein
MKVRTIHESAKRKPESMVSDLLVLADGRIFAHNLSPALAGVLAALNPADAAMKRRAGRTNPLNHELPN